MPKTTKEIRDAAEQTYRWQKKIEKQLCGKKIVAVRYMTPEEAEASGGRAAEVHHEIAKEVMRLAESNRKIPPPKENWQKPE